jgi:ribose transport system ATP-binding protein
MGPAPSTGRSLVEAHGITKRFGGELALDEVDFDLRAGEIHALLGENGAGKSTLIKVLAGVVSRDAGELTVNGQELGTNFLPAEATAAGLAFVHQDLGLLDHLSVAENVALSVGYRTRHGLVSFRATEKHVAGLLAQLSLNVSPRALVGELAQDEKVMVAVARAFSQNARAIVLDEVGSSLPSPTVARLSDALRSARDAGVGFVYVTHRLEEIFGLVDRVTVLRDGKLVVTSKAEGLNREKVVEWLLGSEVADLEPDRDRIAPDVSAPGLRVRGLRGAGIDGPLDFDAAEGEIVAFCGLVGSGTRDLAALLGGAAAPEDGTAELLDVPLALGRPNALRKAGCTYVPGDRQNAGGVFGMSVRENMFLRGSRGFLRPRPERRKTRELADNFDVRPRGDVDRSIGTLSGGNQQKVIAGRALQSGPRMIVVEDPTAGVDIGSRAQLHRILRRATDHGTIVVMASTDYEEVASMADRAFVMRNGRIHAELSGASLTPHRLAQASHGVNEPSTPQEA